MNRNNKQAYVDGERIPMEPTDELKILETPKFSDWKCELFGSGSMGIVYRPIKGDEPNWFWRKMQYLCFGNKWIYDPEGKESGPFGI